MPKSLLDTDIFSEVLKAIDPIVVSHAIAYRATYGRYTIFTITVMEVVKGLHKVGRENRIQQFLNVVPSLEVLLFDTASAEIAGRIYADLERTGQPIGRADPMVAAIAIQQNLPLITGNTAHYQRIVDLGYPLTLANWRS